MAYDEGLAARIRDILDGVNGLVEKKMFGGVGFMLHGNMACGVNKDDLMLRINPAENEKLLSRPHVRVFDMTGKPMKGWVLVGSEALASDKDLERWVKLGLEYAGSLPAK